MTSDDSKIARAGCRSFLVAVLDAGKPSDALGWVPRISPVVAQAAVGAGHWTSGRRRRALAAWAAAAGWGMVAWGLATEAPPTAEVMLKFQQEQREYLRKLNVDAETIRKMNGRTVACQARRRPLSGALERPLFRLALPLAGIPLDVWWGLRHPQRLSVLAVAARVPGFASNTARAGRAIQQRKPRMALGSAVIVAGLVVQLWAASAEPLG